MYSYCLWEIAGGRNLLLHSSAVGRRSRLRVCEIANIISRLLRILAQARVPLLLARLKPRPRGQGARGMYALCHRAKTLGYTVHAA